MFQETDKFKDSQAFVIGNDEVVLDEPEASEETYNIDSLKEIISSGRVEGLSLEQFDNYIAFHANVLGGILATINRCETAERRQSEAMRQLNQLAFDIAKSRR